MRECVCIPAVSYTHLDVYKRQVLLSFLIMSATGITGVIIKKTKLKTKLPFLPFLLMGEVVFLIIQR